MNEKDTLGPLRQHPAFQLAEQLAKYLGVGRDLVLFTEMLSLAAGSMAMPIHLDIQTESFGVDLLLANKILGLLPQQHVHVDTHQQFRALERVGYRTEGGKCAVVLVRGTHHFLQREAQE